MGTGQFTLIETVPYRSAETLLRGTALVSP